MPHGVEQGQVLERYGHAADRKEEPGEDHRRHEHQEAPHERLLLRFGDGRDQKTKPETATDIQQTGYEQEREAAAERHLEPQQSHRSDQHEVDHANDPERDRLAHDQLEGVEGAHLELLEGADLPFPHHGQRREKQTHQQDQDAGDGRHVVVLAHEIGVEPRPLPHVDRQHDLQRRLPQAVALEDALHITLRDRRDVRVRTVDEHLDFGPALPEVAVESGRDLDPDHGVATLQRPHEVHPAP